LYLAAKAAVPTVAIRQAMRTFETFMWMSPGC
jgi:hypothetical protein